MDHFANLKFLLLAFMLPFQTPLQLNLKLVVAGSSLKAPFLFKLFDKPKGREHAHELDYIPLNQTESIVVLCVLSCTVVLCLSFLCLACSLLCHLRRHVCFSYFYHLYLVFFFFYEPNVWRINQNYECNCDSLQSEKWCSHTVKQYTTIWLNQGCKFTFTNYST